MWYRRWVLRFETMSAVVADGSQLPRHNTLFPPAREFLTSAGFGGAAALVAAIIVALIAMFVVSRAARRNRTDLEQQERYRQQLREDEGRAAAVARCWQRFVWVVETAGIEPASGEGATLGLGPELALELLRGLLCDAEQLGDDTLAKSITVYLSQFSLVLAQQGGLLSELVAASPAAAEAKSPSSAEAQRSSTSREKTSSSTSGEHSSPSAANPGARPGQSRVATTQPNETDVTPTAAGTATPIAVPRAAPRRRRQR